MEGRVKKALELLEAHPGGVMIVVGTEEEAAYMAQVAQQAGAPRDRLIADGRSKTTIDNAYYAKRLSDRLNIKDQFLVTSPYHIARALFTFKRVLGPEYQITAAPSRNQPTKKVIRREKLLAPFVQLLRLFKEGNAEQLKKASDRVATLVQYRPRAPS